MEFLFDCCCPHHLNVNELWLCMIMLVITLELAFDYVTNKARISDGGNHAQLAQRFRSKWER
jgi:hypothetical protein